MWWDDDPTLDEGHVRRLSFAEMFRRIGPRIRPHRGVLVLGIGLMLLFVGAELAGPMILRQLIDVEIPGAAESGFQGVLRTAWLYLLVFLVGSAASFLQVVVIAKMGLRIVARLKQDIFDHLLSLGADYFDHHPPGRLLARVESDAERLQMLFSEVALSLLRSLILLFGTFVVMMTANVPITVAVILLVLPFFAGAFLFMRLMRRLWGKVRRSVAQLSTFVTEHVQAVPILQVYGRARWSLHKLDERNRARYRMELGTDWVDHAFWSLFSTLEVLAVILILYLGFGERLGEAMTLGTLVLFVEYTRRLFWPLLLFAEQINFIQRAFASADRVFQILDTPSRVRDRRDARASLPERWNVLEFENVTFAYPTGPSGPLVDEAAPAKGGPGKGGVGLTAPEGEPAGGNGTAGRDRASGDAAPEDGAAGDGAAVQNLSFRIERGQRVALVGPSGSGKSTVMNLLLRFYEPTSGRITIDGVDLREYTQEAWRSKLGLVLQDIHLFPGTVADNLRVFDDSIPEASLERAVRSIGAAPAIERLPRGLETALSEGGQNLSMGQRQLVSFARAVVPEPDLLLLDEATSSIDSATERRIQNSLAEMMRGRTALIVAHRLSTVSAVDRILVLRQGRLVESGRHDELMRNPGGIYRALYDLQFASGGVV